MPSTREAARQIYPVILFCLIGTAKAPTVNL